MALNISNTTNTQSVQNPVQLSETSPQIKQLKHTAIVSETVANNQTQGISNAQSAQTKRTAAKNPLPFLKGLINDILKNLKSLFSHVSTIFPNNIQKQTAPNTSFLKTESLIKEAKQTFLAFDQAKMILITTVHLNRLKQNLTELITIIDKEPLSPEQIKSVNDAAQKTENIIALTTKSIDLLNDDYKKQKQELTKLRDDAQELFNTLNQKINHRRKELSMH